MGEILFRLLLGHFVGDYLVGQNDWIALNKKKKWLPCIIHCLLYSVVVCLFLFPEFSKLSLGRMMMFYGSIFLSHILIDRTNIIEQWFFFIKGRSFRRIDLPTVGLCQSSDVRTVRLIYTCIVQTVADNTLHLLLMFVVVKRFLDST